MDAPADSVFSGPITSTFNAVLIDENPFTCYCEKDAKTAQKFQISQFYWLFSNGSKGFNRFCVMT